MGIYLNPGKKAYTDAVSSEIYVDKSEMILYLNSIINTNQKYVSVSRPRRFGKTITMNMISAYYDRDASSRSTFSNLKLASHDDWDRYLGKFNVIRIVMTDFIKSNINVSDSLKKLSVRILKDLSMAYPNMDYDEDDLTYSMELFYHESGIPFVIIIDEWDAVFREKRDDKEGQRLYLDFLRDWLKDKEYVALAYITGILPIKKYGRHSALNMFDEYSMVSPMWLARYCGFTDDEVKELCMKYGRDYDQIRYWYDGYILSDVIPPDPEHEKFLASGERPVAKSYSIYSPLSVVKAVSTGVIGSYWNVTETYEALAEYIRKDFDGLKNIIAFLMDGGRAKVDLSTYQNDMTTFTSKDDILALLIHLGYLGFMPSSPEDREKGDYGEVFIPNKEVLEVFRASTKGDEWTPAFRSFEKSQEIVEATWACNETKVAELLEWFHDQTSNKTYNDESALSYSVQLAYYAAQKYYTDIHELDTGKGYADIVYLPSPKYSDKPALIIELKYDHSTRTAMDQIRRQNYPQRLEHYKGNILLVSINYESGARNTSKHFKHHTCKIERG